jgi:streptomycin 6-kinase
MRHPRNTLLARIFNCWEDEQSRISRVMIPVAFQEADRPGILWRRLADQMGATRLNALKVSAMGLKRWSGKACTR